jgi:DNA primase large subunit
MEVNEIVKNFVSITDFDEQFTRYQIEHIAGLRGSRTKYTPPTCSTLKTHGICVNPDNLCKTIRHPLTYYRRRLQNLKKNMPPKENSK